MQRNRGNNKMGKTRDLIKETGDTKGTFHTKMGTIKDRKVKDLTEADEIKKRWQECTEELYKNGHKDQDSDDAWVIHVKLDILEYEAKWALGSFTTDKASGSDGIPAELFKNPKE